ncbi:hypothetical protein SCG7086_AA_00560 [Chlamydiales bacterium SCGC AG-110-P3]|nr:hypothetical protein SCG7086_AA_00560 [Chlamydiales bacterium SCGC AG-110-P3]
MTNQDNPTPQTDQDHTTKERRTLLLSSVTAISFHVLMLFLVNGMGLLTHHGSGNETSNNALYARPDESKHNRQEQLNESLKKFVIQDTITATKAAPSNEMEHAPQPQNAATISLPDSESNLTARAADQFITHDALTMNLTDAQDTGSFSSISDTSSMTIDFGDNDSLTQDLIQATDVIAGILPQAYSDIASPTQSSDKIGQRQDTTLDNIGTERRSGSLDAGMRAGATGGRLLSEGAEAREIGAVGGAQVSAVDSSDLTADASSSLGSVASSNDFTIELRYTPARQGGYLFQVKLVPKDGVQFLRIKQNVFFLVDRSRSIDRRRYEISKKAVIDCLEILQPDDTFNILVFDKSVLSMADRAIPWSPQAIERARHFLSKQEYGGMTDLYSSLDKIVPKVVADTEVNTAILMSDGDTFLAREKQRSTISQWSLRNRGKVSLFCMAAGKGNNLPLLDLLAANNKGTLSYCRQHEELPSTLRDLMQRIQNPIGKDIVVTVIPPNDGTEITIFPRPRRLADLYEHTPYVLNGHVNQISDFYIFLQGRYYDRWFDIKQLVSFDKGKPGNSETMTKTWTVHQAYDCYDHFLAEGEIKHLNHAERLLAPFNIPIAFPH